MELYLRERKKIKGELFSNHRTATAPDCVFSKSPKNINIGEKRERKKIGVLMKWEPKTLTFLES